MTKAVFYPYPRLDAPHVRWSEWSVSVDGREVAIVDLADSWDANSELVFRRTVTIGVDAYRNLGGGEVRLILTASCKHTAITRYAAAALTFDRASGTAVADVRIAGRDISEALELRSKIVLPVPAKLGEQRGPAWLSTRVVAEAKSADIRLSSDTDAFPTVAYSFEEHGILDAPWRISINAEEPEAPFLHSIRLELNEDYSLIRDLMDGKPNATVEAELDASITRALVGGIARMSEITHADTRMDQIAAEYPDSLAAGAQRATKTYLKRSLDAAIRLYRTRPEDFEYLLASGTKIFANGRR